MVTVKQVGAAIGIVKAIADSIREVGEVESGKLYSIVCGKLSLSDFQSVIRLLIRADLVEMGACGLLKWIGPK